MFRTCPCKSQQTSETNSVHKLAQTMGSKHGKWIWCLSCTCGGADTIRLQVIWLQHRWYHASVKSSCALIWIHKMHRLPLACCCQNKLSSLLHEWMQLCPALRGPFVHHKYGHDVQTHVWIPSPGYNAQVMMWSSRVCQTSQCTRWCMPWFGKASRLNNIRPTTQTLSWAGCTLTSISKHARTSWRTQVGCAIRQHLLRQRQN